ncbi:Glycosidase [Geoalkalibacter ferrihydriticus]|uniref:Alpha-amylase n=2 Tax=Geoalkalibacter ferrihydriticus TaxID=392333 RepID=A0A0C2HTE1_9BACT|nr:alpha-amylase family glycosyl hydrolase [Geoalkalibacter ferrihydriticus]KIH78070.1 hypothetical protein GFER_05645 [Geoalkalibacter ferrihydriticus DSM 17813]SDM30725.1 Glycosidase [Geoalkalibacter ferrihydriticus]
MSAAPFSVANLDFHPNHPLHPSPRDWRDQAIYFLLVDRFDNNHPGVPAYAPGATPVGRDPVQGQRFQGGNLRGVTRRLDYIRDLGFTTLWLSPIFKNRIDSESSYHGYGIQDFLQIDPRFGTLADLRALTAAAHQRGMYVILDIVLNHSGDVWGYPGGHPYFYSGGQRFPFGFWREQDPSPGFQRDDAIWPVELQDPDLFKRKGEIVDWHDPIQARDGDFFSLKELDLPNPRVLDTLIKVYKYWIVNGDVDGFRIDTVKHMESSATAIFCNAIREYAKRVGKHNFFLFGEIVGEDAVIQEYIGRNARIEGTHERFPSLHAALDFPLYFVLENVIKGLANPAALRRRYEAFHQVYTDHGEAGRYFVTFVDNHDQVGRDHKRFIAGSPFSQQTVLACAYLLTAQGVPCLYYGTEQGFDGGGPDDRYLRECMFGGRWGAFNTTGAHFFNPGHPIYRGIRAVAAVRAAQPALRYGRQYFRQISGNGHDFGDPLDGRCTLAYSRILDSDEILACLNLSAEERRDFITVDRNLSAPGVQLRDLLRPDRTFAVIESSGRACVQVRLEPHEVALLKAD